MSVRTPIDACNKNTYQIDLVLMAMIPNITPTIIDPMISPSGLPICIRHDDIVCINTALNIPNLSFSPKSKNPLK